MPDVDLTILGPRHASGGSAVARSGTDLAIEDLDWSALPPLADFGRRIDAATRGGPRPSRRELRAFGRSLYEFLVRDALRELYHARPRRRPEILRVQIVSNRPEIHAVAWEYLQEPREDWGPSLLRSVVRIVPAVGGSLPEPKALRGRARVLFVYADPLDERPVPWAETRALLIRDFGAEGDGRLALDAVEGTREGLADALQRADGVDVLHFIGHGRTLGGVGHLLLTGRRGDAAPVSSGWLAGLLRGRDVRLVVLTACDSSAGDHAAEFAVLATALVRSGVPAVVANQFPVGIETVAPFVRALYAELLRSGDVDRAVNEGRVRLSADLSPPDDVFEWGIPTLHRRLGAAQVFAP